MRHFFGLGPGDEAAVAKAVRATRLGYPEQASAPGPKAADEPHPTLMRTPAARPREVGRLCRGQRPGRSRYAFVPDAVAIRRSTGSLPQGRVQLGRAHGRGGSSGDSSFSWALRRGSGGFWESASALNPLTLGQLRLIPFNPPTHLRGAARTDTADQKVSGRGRRPIKAAGCRGCGRGHPIGLAWSTDNGLSSLRLAPWAPVRRRLAGRAAAQGRTKRLTSNTCPVRSMW